LGSTLDLELNRRNAAMAAAALRAAQQDGASRLYRRSGH
jgi:hypothetical protein